MNSLEQKYINAGCMDFQLRNAGDLVNILGIDVREAQYYNELSNEYKVMTVNFLLEFMNRCGLEHREGYKITKAYLCQKQELVTPEDEDGCREIVGSLLLNVNDVNNIRIESLSVPEDYQEIKNSLTWEIEKCYEDTTFLRVDLLDGDGGAKWFHVFMKDNEIKFY